MKFVLRDDDLNYFSTPADIERWYSDIFAQGIPVGFSAIPFVMPESDVYTAGAHAESREYPISGNGTLIKYVKGNPLIDILQHGTTHVTKDGVFEYARSVPLAEAQRGRQELETAFERSISVFVPPHDWIGTSGIYAIEAAHLDVLRGRGAGLRNWIVRPQYIAIFFKMLWFKLSHSFDRTVPAYPFVLDFGKHKEACTYRLEDVDVFDGLEFAHRKDGIFVVVVHLHFFTEEKKARLAELIQRARSYTAEFVKPSELFR